MNCTCSLSSLARSCERIRPVFALLATPGESIAIICALLVLQRRSQRPLEIDPRSKNDLGDLRISNTVQLAISPVRSYKIPRRTAALISFYLSVIDERHSTVNHEFIVPQERDRSAIISRFDRNGAASYRDAPPGWLSGERVGLMTWWL